MGLPDLSVSRRSPQNHKQPASTRCKGEAESRLGRRAPVPRILEPQLATLVDHAPEGDGWIHEVKFDGYRVLSQVERGSARLLTRSGLDWTHRMPSLANAIGDLPVSSAVLDGEVVALRRSGLSDFQLLQNSLSAGADAELVYYVFDLLYCNGFDLRAAPLQTRKETLRSIIDKARCTRVRFSESYAGRGADFKASACRLGLEGIISKRVDQPYRPGRGRDWLKVKCLHRQEFVIGGYTDPGGSPARFGALLLGVQTQTGSPGLTYVGKVGTGFSETSIEEIHARLSTLGTSESPFHNPPRGADARRCHWLKPIIVAEVEFSSRTNDGLLRHPTFRGLRDDKRAAEVTSEEQDR